MNKKLTKAEKLLLSAAKLEHRGIRPFSAEQIVVEAWQQFPDAFALEGYPEYPDSNRVYILIMGSKSLRDRGWLLKVGKKMYELSEAGLIQASILENETETPSSIRSTLSRKQKVFLNRLISTAATRKVREGRRETIVFADACTFWEISPRSTAKTFQARVESVESILESAKHIVASGQNIALTHRGKEIGQKDIDMLRKTHYLLLELFREEVQIIRARTDERGY